MPISNMLFALLLTIAIEGGAAFILGYRKKLQLLIIVLVNVITNPALNYILLLFRMIGYDVSFYPVLMLEIAVVFTEWRIMAYAFKTDSKKLFILAALMNGLSYGAGILILGLG